MEVLDKFKNYPGTNIPAYFAVALIINKKKSLEVGTRCFSDESVLIVISWMMVWV